MERNDLIIKLLIINNESDKGLDMGDETQDIDGGHGAGGDGMCTGHTGWGGAMETCSALPALCWTDADGGELDQ